MNPRRLPITTPRHHGGLAQYFVDHRNLGWLAMAAVLLWGWFAFHSLPQQEDPTFPRHDALVVTVFPGATARQVEQLVTQKLESTIGAYDAVEELRSQSRAHVSVVYVMLRSHREAKIARSWDELRARLSEVPLPEGCEPPLLDTDYQATATLLLSVASARHDNRELEQVAERLGANLRQIPSVSRVRLFGNVPERFELRSVATNSAGSKVAPGPIPYSVETLYRAPDGTLANERSVLLAVEMKEGSIIGRFDRAVRAAVRSDHLPEGMSVHTVSDQPAATAKRIGQFITCFNEAVVVVVLVCLFLMDWRTALVVAIAIPLTLALTLGGMALLGVPLHQISIAALIIALGMLVDDPVVAADGINRELAAGQPRGIAAWLGPYRLRRAILFGTIINILAFLPLVLLPGDMGAFIIALPIVITLALTASRIVSVTFVPLLGYHLLRGQRGFEAGGEVRKLWLFKPVDRLFLSLLPHYRHLLRWGLDHAAWTVAIAYGLLAASSGLIRHFDHRFFPAAERHQCLIDIQLPPAAAITETRVVCDRIADILRSRESIVNAVVFCGGTAPNFYYNVLPRAPAANLAQVLINTRDADDVPGLVVKLRAEIDREIFHASCIVRQLDQGPALEAPIMVRLTGSDLGLLRIEADAVSHALRDSGGYKVSDDLGDPVPSEKMLEAGELPEYAVISHTGGNRAVTVKAYSAFDQLPSRVLKRARETIDGMTLPPGYALEYAGEERELKNSRREMQRVMLISLALIALAMVIQFKSIIKSLVVMLTVPLGLAGAFVGLAVTHASFGFMALLGLVSLAGVIVSHIIVLSDFIEAARASGMELKEALLQAGLVRLRAVIVTVLATVCGLVPLALQGGALWRPLTAVHIFGLLLATALTLLVLPVWYYLFAARLRWI